MLRTVAARGESFALTPPFRISRGIKQVADVITIEVIANGYVGWGESLPHAHHGETMSAALNAMERVRNALEAGIGREELQTVKPAGAERSAVDCALWDLETRCADSSVAAMFG